MAEFHNELWKFLRDKMIELEEQSKEAPERARTFSMYAGLAQREER